MNHEIRSLPFPLVSIIVRTRDRPQHLQRAIASLIAQTYRPIEILVVDDGTQSIAELISNYPTSPEVSLRYVRSISPGGRTRAANTGIAAATGTYVGLLDDDDTFSPNHLATLVPILTEGGWQVGYSRCEIVEARYDAENNQWTELNRYGLYADDFDPIRLLLENYIPLMTVLFAREALEAVGGFDENLDIYEDWDLMIRLAARYPFAHVPQVTAQYYFWSAQNQGTLKVRGTAAEQEAYCSVIRKHCNRITPEVLHTYFTIAGQRLGGYLASERQLARARADVERLQQENRKLKEVYVELQEAHRKLDEANRLQETSRQLQDANQQLQEANRQLEEQVSHLYLDIESIKQGVGWKVLERVRRVVATLFPPQTRRRRFYYLAHLVMATYLREGWRGTGRKIALRIRRWHNRPSSSTGMPEAQSTVTSEFALRRPVDIVIPVFNASEDVEACLASIRAHTDLTYHRIIAVDDASTDPGVATLLDREAARGGLLLLRASENQGFVGTVNTGLRASRGDVIILNSDTLVTANWLEKLQRAACSRPGVGTVTPLSNHASICSVPEPMRYNHLPGDFTIDSFAAFVDRIALRHYPEIPAGIGFCLYVKREVLDTIGLLDEEFERGYAEDTDFCLRARQAGFLNVMDDATFIYHRGGRSFESDPDPDVLAAKNRMIQRNLLRLGQRYPEYQAEVTRCLEGPLRFFHNYFTMRLRSARGTIDAPTSRLASKS